MIEIKIYKNIDEIICYSMRDKEFLFTYDSFEELIDTVLFNDEEYQINCEEEFEEYKKLLNGIIQGVKTEDFREAVKNAAESKKNLEDLEKEINI